MAGIHFKSGKIVAREQTEEEKAEAEAGKGKKPADAAKKGAKKGAEEEPSPEELEKLNAEIRDREDSNNKAQGEWNQLDDNTKFFRTCEDVFKEPSIRFVREEVDEEAPPANRAEVQICDNELRKFESAVIDNQGCWIYFDRLVPKDEEEEVTGGKADPKKKAPPAKKGAKDANVEDMKPTHCKGWLDLTPLMHPGAKTVTQRLFINQITAEEANYPKLASETIVGATSS